jgi:hypothetical protein
MILKYTHSINNGDASKLNPFKFEIRWCLLSRLLAIPENFSTLRKLVLHCLENETKTNGGIAFKQWKAALSLDYPTKLIKF